VRIAMLKEPKSKEIKGSGNEDSAATS
jgi:hypothetical protein